MCRIRISKLFWASIGLYYIELDNVMSVDEKLKLVC